jgi:outer membrane murein-binding lipoprotein Lpp
MPIIPALRGSTDSRIMVQASCGKKKKADRVAQMIKCLNSKYEALSSNLSTAKKRERKKF